MVGSWSAGAIRPWILCPLEAPPTVDKVIMVRYFGGSVSGESRSDGKSLTGVVISFLVSCLNSPPSWICGEAGEVEGGRSRRSIPAIFSHIDMIVACHCFSIQSRTNFGCSVYSLWISSQRAGHTLTHGISFSSSDLPEHDEPLPSGLQHAPVDDQSNRIASPRNR